MIDIAQLNELKEQIFNEAKGFLDQKGISIRDRDGISVTDQTLHEMIGIVVSLSTKTKIFDKQDLLRLNRVKDSFTSILFNNPQLVESIGQDKKSKFLDIFITRIKPIATKETISSFEQAIREVLNPPRNKPEPHVFTPPGKPTMPVPPAFQYDGKSNYVDSLKIYNLKRQQHLSSLQQYGKDRNKYKDNNPSFFNR